MAVSLVKWCHLAPKLRVFSLKSSVDTLMIQCTRSQGTIAQTLMFPEYGDPSKVVYVQKCELPSPKDDEVILKMLAAPVNPADINTIQGVYPVKPPLPAICGNEGVGEVTAVGSAVKCLRAGDRVVPRPTGWGTWRTHAVSSERDLIKISSELNIPEAAMLTVNPCTAYRMLKDFVKLKPGDTVIQNGANGACGQYVIQLCKAWGLRSVNIVRKRDNIDELKNFLKVIGASHVLTEEELRTTEIFKNKTEPKPKLALNAVGGKNSMEMLRHLDQGGYMVTYGGMSRQPVTIPTSAFIFKDIRSVGFWMTRWTSENADNPERQTMLDEIMQLMIQKKICAPVHTMIPFGRYKEALLKTLNPTGFAGAKYILDFQHEC